MILVLPFLQPVPLGPLTVIGGITFAVLGFQIWCGHDRWRGQILGMYDLRVNL